MMRFSLPLISIFFYTPWSIAADVIKPANPAAIEYFEKHVRPILVEHCVKCHGEKKQNGALRLDTAAGLTKGSDTGPVVVAGQPEKSKLIAAVKRTIENAMPPDKPLPKEAVAVLVEWVTAGASFPADTTTKPDPMAAKNHWAFRAVVDPAVPPGSDNPIDAFIRAKLHEKKLTPSKPADRRTLIRRVTFDLIGLPPGAEEIEAFENDKAPDAYDKLIDRLLASKQYGERWGRHWLDVARYADSKGYVFQEERNFPFAYTYRDYVIRAFNDDLPFDRFIIEQIAADRLPLGEDKRSLAALGYLTLGRRFLNNQPDIIDDRIDVVSRGMMGLTVSCARCHDHKYDPIPTADYYSLYGVFQNSMESKDLPLLGHVERTPGVIEFEVKVKQLEKVVEDERTSIIAKRKQLHAAVSGAAVTIPLLLPKLMNTADRNELTRLQKRVDEFRATSPAAPPRAHALQDVKFIEEPAIFLRGNRDNRGAKVPRRMPEIVAGADRKPFTDGSGRLELAKAIASPTNPLTARVLVNRVWMYHFGQGLVRTPSDFGIRSDAPTHPELLDWLAKRFVEDGWSVKKLHKRIMLSATYRQASEADAAAIRADPENRWLARQTRQRLEFEPLRDSLLMVSGKLDTTIGGKAVDLFTQPFTKRRTVYGIIERQNLPGTFRAFDLASPDQHTPQRFQTTVPQQALFLMNNPFVAEQATATIARPEVSSEKDPTQKVCKLYRAILSRNPTEEESEAALAFITATPATKPPQLGAWEQLAQVLMLSNEFVFVD